MLILIEISATTNKLVAIVCIPSHSLLRKQGFFLKSVGFISMLENLKIESKSDMVDLVFRDFFNSLVEFRQ